MKKWLQLLIIASLAILVLAACGGGSDTDTETDTDEASETETTENEEATDDGETYVIGATQIVEHPSLDTAYEGFQQALEDAGLNVEYDFQSAQGDQNN